LDPVQAFGEVLREFREEAGLTQEGLALEAEVERNYVSLIEHGINQPAVRIIFKLAIALCHLKSRKIAPRRCAAWQWISPWVMVGDVASVIKKSFKGTSKNQFMNVAELNG